MSDGEMHSKLIMSSGFAAVGQRSRVGKAVFSATSASLPLCGKTGLFAALKTGKLKSHIQIAVRDPKAIIGYFRPEGM